MVDNRQLKDAAIPKLFGESREFLTPRSLYQDRTPLVNNVLAAHIWTDQWGRVYAPADPVAEEYDFEARQVPWIMATDRLFVAIVAQARQEQASLPPETQQLPQPNETLLLQRPGQAGALHVEVDTVQEPTKQAPRKSSALVTLSGLVPITRPGDPHPDTVFRRHIDSITSEH